MEQSSKRERLKKFGHSPI